MDQPRAAIPQDAPTVSGLSALLHPDREPPGTKSRLDLTLRSNGDTYTATIVDMGDAWASVLEDTRGGSRSGLDATQDAAIVSALLGALNTTWLHGRTDD